MRLRAQRGSILAGTIALCLVLSAGAAGVLAVAGAWNSQRTAGFDRLKLMLAAESGILIGARWMRQVVTEGSLSGYTGEYPVSSGGYVSLDGVDVKVTLEFTGGVHYLVAIAKMPVCTEAFRVRWTVGAVAGGGGGILSTVTFTEWNEASIACP